MPNYSDKATEAELQALEKKLQNEYRVAYAELNKKAEDYFSLFQDRYEKEYAAYQAGKYTDSEFKLWYQNQVGRGKRWEQLRDSMAQKITETNTIASAYINNVTPAVYATNANYAAFQVSNCYGLASFDVVNEQAVRNLMTEDGNFTEFRVTSINPKRDYAWNSQKIQQALTQGIMQGKDINSIANSFLSVMGRNKNSAIRNARTAVTSAQNGGRLSTMNKAAEMGLKVQKQWVSAHDGRVRDSHAHLDGQIRDIDKKFGNGLMCPGDSKGAPGEVYNCRCAIITILPDYEDNTSTDDYKEWLKAQGIEDNGLNLIKDNVIINSVFTKTFPAYKKAAIYNGYSKLSELPKLKEIENIEKAVAATNPKYKNILRGVNASEEYSKNCQRCVVALEARLRGYNVTAGARRLDVKEDIAVTILKGGIVNKNSWLSAFVGGAENIKKLNSPLEIINEMDKYGNGARAIVRCSWKAGRAGHVFHVINENGVIYAYDAQKGNKKKIIDTLSRMKTDSAYILRTDNIDLTDDVVKMVEVNL